MTCSCVLCSAIVQHCREENVLRFRSDSQKFPIDKNCGKKRHNKKKKRWYFYNFIIKSFWCDGKFISHLFFFHIFLLLLLLFISFLILFHVSQFGLSFHGTQDGERKRENQVLGVKLTLIEWIYMFIASHRARGEFVWSKAQEKSFLTETKEKVLA